MSVTAINITIEQGEDFSSSFSIKNPDESNPTLTNYNTLSTLKKYPGSSAGIGFTSALNSQTSVVTIGLGRTTTSSLIPGRHYYDVFIISPSGVRTKVVEGNALVNASATIV